MEPDRCLARVVKIISLDAIEGADRIELATVLGWQVVVAKNEFKVGDLAVYFSISSILDKNHPRTSFLEGKPIKTKKIRGVLSQGLLAPLSWLPDFNIDPLLVKEDDDLTMQLNIKKWVPFDEEEIYKQNTEIKASFPIIVPRTNEERVQNCSKKLFEMKDRQVVITQKYDGTSTTFIYYKKQFMICNRNNLLLKDDNSVYYAMAKKYNLEEKLKELDLNIAIQGETIGPKIGCNRHKINEVSFFVFNIYDIDRQYYMNWNEIKEISEKLDVQTVKLVYQGPMQDEWFSISNLLKMADETIYETGTIGEGLVMKTDDSFGYPRTSFKIISNKYLLKYGL